MASSNKNTPQPRSTLSLDGTASQGTPAAPHSKGSDRGGNKGDSGNRGNSGDALFTPKKRPTRSPAPQTREPLLNVKSSTASDTSGEAAQGQATLGKATLDKDTLGKDTSGKDTSGTHQKGRSHKSKPHAHTRKPPQGVPQQSGKNLGLESRMAAIETLFCVLYQKRPLDAVFDQLAYGLSHRDRAFCRQLVLLTLRRRAALRYLLGGLMDKPLSDGAERIALILEVGLAQILFMDTKDHAAVDQSVRLVKKLRGPVSQLSGLVNAVLRRSVRTRNDLLAELVELPAVNLPQDVFVRWVQHYNSPLLERFSAALTSLPPLDIRFKDKETRDQSLVNDPSAQALGELGLRLTGGDIETLPGFEDGKWWVQDASAAIPATLFSLPENSRVLDMCAAPGGKTMQLAARGYMVTALDRSGKRLKRLDANLERTGLSAEVIETDAADYEPNIAFDGVLLDAPCSATGTFRRNPDVLWTKTTDDIARLADLQSRLLDHAVSLLRVGGELVYCVCSMEESEGEAQWQAFLERTNGKVEACPITADDLLRAAGPTGSLDAGSIIRKTTPLLSFLQDGGWLRTSPICLSSPTGDITAPIAAISEVDPNSPISPDAHEPDDQGPDAAISNQPINTPPPVGGFDGFFIAKARRVK